MKNTIINSIIKNNNIDTAGIDIDIDKIKLSERSIAVCAMRLEGKTYRAIGEALGVCTERARQLEKQAVCCVRRYIKAEKVAAAEKAAEKAAAEKKTERLGKVVPGKTETWRALSIYDLDPSVRLFTCLVRWFERNYSSRITVNGITVGMIVDALGDYDYRPLTLKTLHNAGLKTWEELLRSLDRVMKNDESSSLFKKYYNSNANG